MDESIMAYIEYITPDKRMRAGLGLYLSCAPPIIHERIRAN
jgi:hypothetical protein